jgi:hypothetical protein
VILALALLLGAASLAPGSARAAAARSADRPVEVGITRVDPQIPNFSDTTKQMTFGGSLRNTGTTTLKDLHLEVQPSVVDARSEMGSADGRHFRTKTQALGELAPNAIVSWTVSARESVLFGYVSPPAGVYAFDIDVFDSDGTFLGGKRTFVVWKPKEVTGAKPARVALMWPVVGQPLLTGQRKADPSATPILTDQTGVQQFAPNGRLARIMDEGQKLPAVNWLLDPDLLYTASQLGNGYFYGSDKPVGANGGDATAWYAKAHAFFTSPQARNCWSLVYGDPDLNTLAHSGDGQNLLRGAVNARPPTITQDTCRNGTVAWPANGQADATTLQALAGTKVPLITLLGSNAVSTWPSSHAALPDSPNTVVYDNYLSSIFADQPKPGQLDDTGVLDGQLWLAQTALAADKDGTDRVLVAAPPRDFDPPKQLIDAIASATDSTKVPAGEQWVGLDDLGKVLSVPATAQHVTALTKISTPNQPAAVVQEASDSQQFYQSLHAIMLSQNDYDYSVPFRPVATWWRDHSGASAYSGAVYKAVVDDFGLVSIGGQTEPLTLSGKTGKVPITIQNGTKATIRVYLGVQSSHTLQLKVAEDQGLHIIPPGQNATVRIPVQAGGNGLQVRLTATLYTCSELSADCTYYPSNLHTPLKDDNGQTPITVKVSRIGIIALALMIGSGMLLILLIGLRVYRAKRTHHAPAQDTMAS